MLTICFSLRLCFLVAGLAVRFGLPRSFGALRALMVQVLKVEGFWGLGV